MIRWPLLLTAALCSALFVAWQALVAMNFLYPIWHRMLSIDETVRVYGPQNRNRHGFEKTSAEEHARLFAAIVQAVENGGRGLEELNYRDPQGHDMDRLLTPPEIVHLRDVARLVHRFRLFGCGSLVALLVIALSLRLRPASRPPLKQYLGGIALLFLITGIVVLAIGPEAVFYKFHTWIFPAGHQWFFYYQDSLMTTLMQAPTLFAGIAIEWLMLALIIFLSLVILATVPHRPRRKPRAGITSA